MTAVDTTPPVSTERSALGPALLRSYRQSRPVPDEPPAPVRSSGRPWPPERVDRAIAQRRAVHQFAELAMDPARLEAVAAAAVEADHDLWPLEADAGRPLHLVLLAWRVAGLTPGGYEWDGHGWRLVASLPGSPPPTAREFVIQSEFATAPALLLAGGDLRAALATHGGAGHRLLAVRAAAALHTAWLETVASGGYGCFFGAVVDAAVRRHVAADGDRRSLVAGLALGFPDQEPGTAVVGRRPVDH